MVNTSFLIEILNLDCSPFIYVSVNVLPSNYQVKNASLIVILGLVVLIFI